MPVNLRSYDTVASLPESLRQWAQTNPAEGLYEFEAEELHVAVIPTENKQPAGNNEKPVAGNAQNNAFVVFDVAGIEAASSEDWWLLLVISGVVGTLGARPDARREALVRMLELWPMAKADMAYPGKALGGGSAGGGGRSINPPF